MNDWYLLVLLAILGYFERALRRESSSGSRGGGSRLCKQDVGCKIDLKNLCVVDVPILVLHVEVGVGILKRKYESEKC